MSDKEWMALAVETAKTAPEADMPVGALLVCDGKIEARAVNRARTDDDPTAHAEMLALREGARALGSSRLNDCTLYVTLEPCPMCAAAIVTARVGRVVYGAARPTPAPDVFGDGDFNRTTTVTGGVLAEECAALLKETFAGKRGGTRRICNQCLDEETFALFLALTAAAGIAVEAAGPDEADTFIAREKVSGYKKTVAPPEGESDAYFICCVLYKRIFDRTPLTLPAENPREEALRRRAVKYRG